MDEEGNLLDHYVPIGYQHVDDQGEQNALGDYQQVDMLQDRYDNYYPIQDMAVEYDENGGGAGRQQVYQQDGGEGQGQTYILGKDNQL